MATSRPLAQLLPPQALAAILAVFMASPSVLAVCYVLRTPQVGYIAGAEEQPCTALLANGCSTYQHCPPGSKCEWVLAGRRPCTRASIVVPMINYTNGAASGAGQCCISGTVGLPHPTLTCTIPADTLGTTRCPFMEPVPE